MLIVYACNQLQSQLGESLIARPEERLIVEEPFSAERPIYPDLRVVEHTSQPVRAQSATAVAEPFVFRRSVDPAVERFIEIHDTTHGGRVITVIEFVSPGNKLPGDGQRKYQRKQEECFDAGVNLIEIDLTRTGSRNLLAHRFWAIPAEMDTTYAISVWNADEPSEINFYPVRLDHALPAIEVPLRKQDS
jgi:hypothetical protein